MMILEKGTPVVWDQPGHKLLHGVIDMEMDDWFGIQWENGAYTRYEVLRKYEYIKPDYQKIREEKLDELFKSENIE